MHHLGYRRAGMGASNAGPRGNDSVGIGKEKHFGSRANWKRKDCGVFIADYSKPFALDNGMLSLSRLYPAFCFLEGKFNFLGVSSIFYVKD